MRGSGKGKETNRRIKGRAYRRIGPKLAIPRRKNCWKEEGLGCAVGKKEA